MDGGTKNIDKKKKKAIRDVDSDDGDGQDGADDDLIASLEQEQARKKAVSKGNKIFSDSTDSFTNSSCSKFDNLPYLVQLMQPGMDMETVQEEGGKRASIRNYSLKRSHHSARNIIPMGSPELGSKLKSTGKARAEDKDAEDSDLESDPLLKVDQSDSESEDAAMVQKDALLGRSLRVNTDQNKSNKECFVDHLMEHVAHAHLEEEEEDNQSIVFVGVGKDEGKNEIAATDCIDSTTKDDIEGGTIAFTEKSEISQDQNESIRPESSTPSERTSLLGATNKAKQTTSRLRRKNHRPRLKRSQTKKILGLWGVFRNIIRPMEILASARNFLFGVFLLLMVPLMGAAAVLFYVLGNPSFETLFDGALAWYVLLVVRWLVTLTLARMTQYLLVLATIRTNVLARWAGPFVTLMAMQSIGWPFLCFSWGTWNLLILHGKAEFCRHWLFFSGIALFSPVENPDADGILESNLYGRILCAMVGVGFVSGLKRTMTALFLSRRMLIYYKPQLKEMMYQMKLVTGVAGLAAETKKPGFGTAVSDAVTKATQTQIDRETAFMDAVPDFAPMPPPKPHGHAPTRSEVPLIDVAKTLGNSSARVKQDCDESDDSDSEDYDDKTVTSEEEHWERSKNLHSLDQTRDSSTSSAVGHVMATIESWDPPVDKRYKDEPTLHDIVQFRQAVAFMEGDYPFSRAFGLCNSRMNCLRSAIKVYNRLLKFIPQDEAPTLLYGVIGALAYNGTGEWHDKRATGLMALFTPDKDNRISRNAFASSCDEVYKKMLFLRASMNNSSKIDGVLEDIFDCLFYGILAVVVLSLLGLDIWPLLVSASTMLLSFTFAFSASTARTVEGIMLIAVRRPFDIGDRITITSAANMACPGVGNAWLVEDIDLTTTTLKYLATNEVCTINNSTLTHNRIVNFNRSPKARMCLFARFTIDATHKQIDRFRRRLKRYLRNRPRSWDALLYFRNFDLNKSEGFITYMLGVQHTQPWQNPAVMASKAKLELQLDKVATQLKILYVCRPNTMQVEISDDAKKNQ